MKKIITIRLNNGSSKQVSAESRGGYAIHPTSVLDTIPMQNLFHNPPKTGWTVTHIESGMAIIDQLNTRKTAREFLAEFRKIITDATDCNAFASGTPHDGLTPKQKADKKEIHQLILRYKNTIQTV